MFLLGFDFGISSYNISKIDFSYKGSVFSTKPTANGTPISFGFSSTNQAIFSPQIVSLTLNGDNGSSNLNVIPKENKIVSLSLKFLGRII
jgi:hypothetical protein